MIASPRAHRRWKSTGFTLTEMVTTMASGVALVMAVGFILFDSQRFWDISYARAHGDPAIDQFVAQTVFDGIVRKSSKQYAAVDTTADTLRVFYYEGIASSPNRYAQFALKNNSLCVTHGTLQPGTYEPLKSLSEVQLCNHVQDLNFALAGTNILMTLTLSDSPYNRIVTCSAVRNCP